MNRRLEVLRKSLLRNNFDIDFINGRGFRIKQIHENSQYFNWYLPFAVISFVIGCLALYYWVIWGFILIVLIIPILLRLSNQQVREKKGYGRELLIADKHLELNSKNENLNFEFESIKDVSYSIDKNDDLSSADLYIKLKDDSYLSILEIFGDSHRYIEDDILLVAEFITDIMNGDLE